MGVNGGMLSWGGVHSFEMCTVRMCMLVRAFLVFKAAAAVFVLLRLWLSRGL